MNQRRRYALVPGRHLALPRELSPAIVLAGVEVVIFAITSANQAHSRYNPIPFHVRAIGVDRFARALGLPHRIVGIPHYPPTARFARHVLREIEEQTEGRVVLEPSNTIVLSSTPELAAQYSSLGFQVSSAGEVPAIDIIRRLVEHGLEDAQLVRSTSDASLSVFRDFPEVPQRVTRLWRDPLLDDAGSITETRDYGAYVFALSDPRVIQMKYDDVKSLLAPGKIADEGCADGALLSLVARDFPDSDLVGIEITGELFAQCVERQRRGEFGGAFVHFHQRNLFEEIFEPGSIDTTICNSTLHELWSYGDGDESVRAYLVRKYRQAARGGRLVIRDVVGPEDKERLVAMECEPETARLFEKFAVDFQAVPFQYERRGERYVLRLRDAVEFMTKKDYRHNWQSEMKEAFAFWSFSEWRRELERAGFRVIDASRTYTNPWIVENRWRGKLALYELEGGLIPWPPTTMILAGEKVEVS